MADEKEYLDYEGLQELVKNTKNLVEGSGHLVGKGAVDEVGSLPDLESQKIGWMYKVEKGGATTSAFAEGRGVAIPDGSTVYVANVGSSAVQKKWRILGSTVDVSDRLAFGSAFPESPTEGEPFLYTGETVCDYVAVVPEGGENPSEEGWLENGAPTEDTAVDEGKEYYKEVPLYVGGTVYVWRSGGWKGQSSSGDILAPRVSQLERNQGDMSGLPAQDLASAIIAVSMHSVKSFAYEEPNLTITYNDGTTTELSLLSILAETQVGELADVDDSAVKDGEILQYNMAEDKYQPYDLVAALSRLLSDCKAYTDSEIRAFEQSIAFVCDEKPSYDSESGKVSYKQGGEGKETAQASARFFYKDDQGIALCSSWVDGVEFTYTVSDIRFKDYVSKAADVTSSYEEGLPDKDKVPNVAALDALLAVVKSDYLAGKVGKSDVVDSLTSRSEEKPLSANQGYLLKQMVDLKSDKIQFDSLPTADAAWLGRVVQTVPEGKWHRCAYDEDGGEYYWEEVSSGNSASVAAERAAREEADASIQLQLNKHRGVAVTLYNTEADKPTAIDFENGIVTSVGASAYVLATKKWYRCTAIDTTTLAITWEEFDGLGSKLVAGNGISIDESTGAISSDVVEFHGTHDEWDALSASEQAKYNARDFTDDVDDDDTLQEEIEELQGDVSTNTTDIKALKTRTQAVCTSVRIKANGLTARKSGKVVTVNGATQFSADLTRDSWIEIATLPSGYRPYNYEYGTAVVDSGEGSVTCPIDVAASGSMRIFVYANSIPTTLDLNDHYAFISLGFTQN